MTNQSGSTNRESGVVLHLSRVKQSVRARRFMKRGDLNSAGGTCAYFGIYIIYIHDKRAHYFSTLLPGKYSLINQSANSITEKSPT